MAVYNGRDFLGQQIESVLAQLAPGDELVIVDDASTDGWLDLLTPAMRGRMNIIRHDANRGVVRAFEHGLALATGEIVFLCDQDDVWHPDKRATFVAEFERDESVYVVVSDAEIIDQHGSVVSGSFMATRGGFHGGIMSTLWRNRYLGCAMAVRRAVVRAALPFPAGLPMHDMWLGALGVAAGRVKYVPRALLGYRRHGGNATPLRSRWRVGRLLRWRITLAALLAQRIVRVRLGRHRS
jgi:GT2 family glycosyltransferase